MKSNKKDIKEFSPLMSIISEHQNDKEDKSFENKVKFKEQKLQEISNNSKSKKIETEENELLNRDESIEKDKGKNLIINSRKSNFKSNLRNSNIENEKLILNVNRFSIPDEQEEKSNTIEVGKNVNRFSIPDDKQEKSTIEVRNKGSKVKFDNDQTNEIKKSLRSTIEKLKLFTKNKYTKNGKKIEIEENEPEGNKNDKISEKYSFKITKTFSSKNLPVKKKSKKNLDRDKFKFNQISPIVVKNKNNLIYLNNLEPEDLLKNQNLKFEEKYNSVKNKKEELTEEEKKKYFLSSKELRRMKSKNDLHQDCYDDKNNISINKLIDEESSNFNENEMIVVSENSLFYKDDYFQKNFKLQVEENANHAKYSNKDEHNLNKKLIYYYLNPRKNSAMPKFSKISIKEKKCNEIMEYKKANDEELRRQFYDEYPCFRIRSLFYNFFERVKKYFAFVKSPIFDNISLFIIIVNTCIILYSNPNDSQNLADKTDEIFLFLFTAEMFFKFLAIGLVIPKDSYFRDMWNILDFLVVLIGWISYLLERTSNYSNISGLNGLRSLRILRPLRTIKSIKGLRRLIATLIESIFALGDIIIVLLFFFIIFAITGVQIWEGLFLRRCHSAIYGYPLPINDYRNMCTSNEDCKIFNSFGERFFCASAIQNPNINTTHYDDLLNAMTTVFIITTMEGWVDIFKYASQTFKDEYYINTIIILIYFLVILFVGGYYLINLYLAVINYTYCEIELKNKKKRKKENLSLYGILMETFNKTGEEENDESLPVNEYEIKDEVKEARKNKLKEECNLFNFNLDKYQLTYEGVMDIQKIRKYKPKELFELKKNILAESLLALEEYDKKKELRKKIEMKHKENNKVNNKNKNRKSSINNKSIANMNRMIFYDKGHGRKVVLSEIIPKSISKTLKSFESDLQKGNIEIEKKDRINKIKIEYKKRKIQDILYNQIENSYEEGKKSNDESDDDNDKKVSEIYEKKKSGNTQINNCCEDDKHEHIISELTYSVNTSENNSSYGYINESFENDEKKNKINRSPNNLFRNMNQEIDKDQYFRLTDKIYKEDNNQNLKNSDVEEKNDKDKENKISRSSIFTKNILIEEKNNISNKMIINKPDNPLILIPKHENDNLIKKKIEDFNENFHHKQVINEKDEKEKILLKKYKNKDKKFLDFLKYTQLSTNKFQKISIEEMRKYEEFLDQQNSLEISKEENEPNVIINSNNKNDSLLTENENNQIEEIEKLEEIKILEKAQYDLENKKNTIRRILTAQKNSGKKSGYFFSIDIMERGKKLDFNTINSNLEMNFNDNKDTINKKAISLNQSESSIVKNSFVKKIEITNSKEIFNYDDEILKEIYKNKSYPKRKRRSYSIEKNKIKFSNLTFKIEKEIKNDEAKEEDFSNSKQKEENFAVRKHLKSYRNYMKYLNFVMDKDYKIKDKFCIDDFLTDVMGKCENMETDNIKDPGLDPIRFFNKKNLNLKTNSYVKYLEIPEENLNRDQVKNNLKFLSSNVINSMYDKTKNFRKLTEKIKKKLNIITINGDTSHLHDSQNNLRNLRTDTNFNSTFHKSISSINNRNKSIKKNLLLEIEEEKRKNRREIYNNFLQLSLRKKCLMFFEHEKLQKFEKEKKEDNSEIAKIEIETNWEQDDKKLKIEEIRNFDRETNTVKYKEWSGYHVMNYPEDECKFSEWNILLENMENTNIIIWEMKYLSIYIMRRIRYLLFLFSTSKLFEYFVLFVVFLNVLSMLFQGNLLDPDTFDNLLLFSLIFNSFFIFEFIVKFIGLGPIIYFSDAFTYLDSIIVALAILDISTTTIYEKNEVSEKLEFLQVLRIFRVLRIAKILRKITSFRRVLRGISNSLSNVAYNSLILFIFIIIFQMIGVSFFYQNSNYRDFLSSFYVTFQLLTIENWNEILFELNQISRASVIYLISLIFIGNYILFNLFISILLNTFDSLAERNIDEDEYIKSLPEEFKKYELKEMEINSAKKKEKFKFFKKKIDDEQYNFIDNISSSSEEEEYNQKSNSLSQISDLSYSGAKKFMRKRIKVNVRFNGNECEYSLFIFSQTSKFRIFCKNLISYKNFDRLILLIILLSTLRLIIDTFINISLARQIFGFFDIIFTLIFILEMMLKVIAKGFILDEGSYLKDNWNRMDFIIVIFSIIDLEYLIERHLSKDNNNIDSTFGFLKVIRLLRTLRPLRFISHNVQLKVITTSLFDALGPIKNLFFIVFIVMLIFNIIGMNLFYDLYHTCYNYKNDLFQPVFNFDDLINFNRTNTFTDTIKINNICTENNGIFDAKPSFEFSNIFTSFLTTYVLSIGEGWSEIMNNYRTYSNVYGLFFIVYYLVVTNFFFNLFVGVLFSSFNEAWNKEHKKEITENSEVEQYWDFLKQIDIVDPEFSQFYAQREKVGFKKTIYDIALSKYLETFITLVIVANMITMGVDYQGSSAQYKNVLADFNLFFTSIFIVEAVLKILALGPKAYFYVGWNRFDFFVVCASLLDISMKTSNTADVEFLKSFQIIRVLRVLRVTRVLRLVKSLRGLEKLLQTLRWSLGALMNVLILMLLVFCIFSIIGCNLFKDLTIEKYPNNFSYYDEYFNFSNFYYSFLLNFRAVTGENWNLIMVEVANANKNDSIISYIYFIVMTFITYVIMLNLFLLVILQQFEDFSRKQSNPIEKFNYLLKNFKIAWNKHSNYNDRGFRIKCTKLTEFFREFNSEIMKGKKKDLDFLKKYILDLGLLNDENDFVYFQDVLYKMIKYEFGNSIDRKKNILVARLEDKLMRSIKIKIDFFLKNDNNKSNKKTMNVLNTFNPLTSHLYYKNSFKYIKCFLSKIIFLKLEKYIETQEENLISRVTGYNEDDMNFINNRHKIISTQSQKKGIIHEYQEELNRGIADNFEGYNQILRSGEKKNISKLPEGNLANLPEENEIECNNSEENNNNSRVINSFEFKKLTNSNKEESESNDEQLDHIKKKID